jgi:hypothetical protein
MIVERVRRSVRSLLLNRLTGTDSDEEKSKEERRGEERRGEEKSDGGQQRQREDRQRRKRQAALEGEHLNRAERTVCALFPCSFVWRVTRPSAGLPVRLTASAAAAEPPVALRQLEKGRRAGTRRRAKGAREGRANEGSKRGTCMSKMGLGSQPPQRRRRAAEGQGQAAPHCCASASEAEEQWGRRKLRVRVKLCPDGLREKEETVDALRCEAARPPLPPSLLGHLCLRRRWVGRRMEDEWRSLACAPKRRLHSATIKEQQMCPRKAEKQMAAASWKGSAQRRPHQISGCPLLRV